MKRSSIRKRLIALRKRLEKISPDTLWIIQPENRRYLSGFRAEDMQLNESSGSLLINKRHSILLTDSRYTAEAKREASDFEVVTLKNGIIEDLPKLLARLKTKILGFEEDHLTCKLHRQISKRLRALSKPIRLTSLKGLVDSMREIKDGIEIDTIEASANMMTAILDEVIEKLQPGLTERQISWEIEGLSREAGAEGLAFPPIVASGPNGALPHAVTTERKIRPREPIILDVGLKHDGYCCDISRTVFLETPGPKFRKIYMTVRRAQLSALEYIKPGKDSTYPDSIARDVISDAGFGDYFGHSLGHGVGLAVHENPRLAPRKPVKLKQGMVVTVEPGIYIPGKGGVRLEEMVVIERNGPRLLTKERHLYDF